jgi:hypothetical protein
MNFPKIELAVLIVIADQHSSKCKDQIKIMNQNQNKPIHCVKKVTKLIVHLVL